MGECEDPPLGPQTILATQARPAAAAGLPLLEPTAAQRMWLSRPPSVYRSTYFGAGKIGASGFGSTVPL